MKMKLSRFLHITTVALTAGFIACGLGSCSDDYFDIDPEIGDGESALTATVTFSPVLDALDDTRAAGNSLTHINSLCVIIYDSNNRFFRKVTQGEMMGYAITDNDKTSPDALPEGTHATLEVTPKATFTIPGVPFGKYHIYAVANMGDLSEYDIFHPGESTPEELKDIPLTWNCDNVSANDQMFGYFTMPDEQRSVGFDAPLVAVNRSAMPLHAWMKRAASKVTVNVDGSGLNNGVHVWIKSIQIRDIPTYCYLGKDHTASSHLIADGEKITVSDAEGMNGPEVSRTSPNLFDPETVHSQTAPALFFYENMQGVGQSKKQVWPGVDGKPVFPDGNNPNSSGFKDSKVSGTYVEVIGYYRNNEGSGPIVYRFMLGKDTDKNYDAQRNYHYKLTLKLKNNANDNDWHIVYDREPEIIAKDPYYISYLYDQTMTMPIKIMGHKLISLRADIVENGWHAFSETGANIEAERPKPYWNEGTPNDDGPWNGFLSLRKTRLARFGMISESNDRFGSFGSETYTYNKTYYETNDRGWRVYDVTPGEHKDSENGDYSIATNGAGEWTVRLPFYTRAAVMVEQTGYTGNNPYVAYRRMAKVKFTAEIEDRNGNRHTVTTYDDQGNPQPITIYQMRRIVNPKGIWRRGDSQEEFHVVMKYLPTESASEFKPLISDGPWRAVVQSGKDWIEITPTPGASQKNPDGSISGTGDPYDKNNKGCIIDFTYKPKGTTTTARGGIIRIYYNNYSCVHNIFVRQGYAPVSFYSSTTKWHTSNMRTWSQEEDEPVAEGSYFRRYNTNNPIDASNNTEDGYYLDANGTVVWRNQSNKDFKITGQTATKKWSQITTTRTNWGPRITLNGKRCRIMGAGDIDNLVNNSNTIYGFGVLYADGSKETADKVADVYGARHGATAGKGMRGAFVCDSITGTQIFFPIGASGYGRFKQRANGYYARQRNGYSGVNQYANRYQPMPMTGSSVSSNGITRGVNYKPLLWDIYRRPGALYWMAWVGSSPNATMGTANNGSSLDMNYYSFNFAWNSHVNLGLVWTSGADPSGTDAIFIRMVED